MPECVNCDEQTTLIVGDVSFCLKCNKSSPPEWSQAPGPHIEIQSREDCRAVNQMTVREWRDTKVVRDPALTAIRRTQKAAYSAPAPVITGTLGTATIVDTQFIQTMNSLIRKSFSPAAKQNRQR